MARICLLLCLIVVVAGCSERQLYSGAQFWQQQQCHKIADDKEYQDCMAATETSYDAYKRALAERKVQADSR